MKTFTVEFLYNGKSGGNPPNKRTLTSVEAPTKAKAIASVRKAYIDFCIQNKWEVDEPELVCPKDLN